MKSSIIFFIAALFSNFIFAQSPITDEAEARIYLDQNYDSLEPIEGIYRIDVKFSDPILQCPNCQYKSYTITGYDRVCIIKNNNHIYQYSFFKNRTTGNFTPVKSDELMNSDFTYDKFYATDKYIKKHPSSPYKYSACYTYSYKIESINDPNSFSLIIFDTIAKVNDDNLNLDISMEARENKIFDFFGNKYVHALQIKCDDSFYDYQNDNSLSNLDKQKEESLHSLLWLNYHVTFSYVRIFPLKDYTPQPKYEYGTGFAISSDGTIVTNYHVIKDFLKNSYVSVGDYSNNQPLSSDKYLAQQDGKVSELKVIVQGKDAQENEYTAYVRTFDKENDIAILKIKDTVFKGFGEVPFHIKALGNLGENVFTLGYPLEDVMGHDIKLSSGMITGMNGINDEPYAFTLNLSLNPGNSGGALFDNDGNIVGIVCARLNDEAVGVKVENVSYAIKAEKLLALIGNKQNNNSLNTLRNLSLEQKIKAISPFIVQIKTKSIQN